MTEYDFELVNSKEKSSLRLKMFGPVEEKHIIWKMLHVSHVS